jgi:transcriptional regulator with XRE-family HTH domain
MGRKITNQENTSGPAYGRVRTPKALGELARQERKSQGLTLDKIYTVTGLTTRFLSEFERGKPNASIGRIMDALQALGLEMLILPRDESERILAQRKKSSSHAASPGKGE